VIKLQKYINNSRTFQNEISNNKVFIDFNNYLNKKIIETLFDFNIIPNTIINEEKKNIISLEEEKNEIENILNIINNKNMNKNINGVKESEKDILEKDINNNNNLFIVNNKTNINPYINIISNSSSNSNSLISSTNNSCKSSTHKRNKNIFSDDDEDEEKSLNLICKEIKNKNKDINKIYITHLNNAQIYDFLNYIDVKENNYLKGKINKDQIIQKFEEIITNFNIYDNDKEEFLNKKIYLRKNVCVKLYKAFRFLFKKYKINERKIKYFCKYIENKARIIDCEMGIQYKEYILSILKKLSFYN